MKNIKFLKTFVIYSILSAVVSLIAIPMMMFAFSVFSVLQIPEDSKQDVAALIGYLISLVFSFFIFRWCIKEFIMIPLEKDKEK